MWKIELTVKAEKQFSKLDKQTKSKLIDYFEKLSSAPDPLAFGKPLVGEFSGLWRYRFGKYRIICDVQKKLLLIEVIKIGKRENVYD